MAALGFSRFPIARAQPAVFSDYPFSLGVASGYPTSHSLVLWTRIAPKPHEPTGGMSPIDVEVIWEIATDDQFRSVVRRGVEVAAHELGHSVHVLVSGLEPSRHYWYRFTCGGTQSQVGRSKTAAGFGQDIQSIRLGIACCQDYELGFFSAYASMANDDLDLVLHVGDYIYEDAGISLIREHALPEAETLDDYRRRYALYKTDPALQRAHASAPWVATWDDHEVDNNYSGSVPENELSSGQFIERRTAAYQAYYEHLPFPPSMRPQGTEQRIYTRLSLGGLADVYLLDGRQYRSPHACGRRVVKPCSELFDPRRSMLGQSQEQWLLDSLAERQTSWNLLAQPTVFAQIDQLTGPDVGFWYDGWSGYPASRDRLTSFLVERDILNSVVLSGDVHAFMINDIASESTDIISTEVVTTSITSAGPFQAVLDGWRRENANIRFADGRRRGYSRLSVSPVSIGVEFVSVDSISRPESASRVIAAWEIANGRPGAISDFG